GRACVCGHDLSDSAARRRARRDVGILFQDPESQVVGATVEEDVAFGLENLGLPTDRIADRVAVMLERFGLDELRLREPHRLSGGQKQRTALAGVMAVPRRLMVLDEPTAMLDAEGAAGVLAAVRDLRSDGLTVLSVTQEMDEVPHAERVVALKDGRAIFEGTAADLFADERLLAELSLGAPLSAEVALELRRLGHRVESLPLTIDDLVAELARLSAGASAGPAAMSGVAAPKAAPADAGATAVPRAAATAVAGMAIDCRDVTFGYEGVSAGSPAVAGVTFASEPGTATALLGPSGSGKSTLLLLLRGLLEPDAGRVTLDGAASGTSEHRALQRQVGIVFQRAEAQLFAATAFDDVAFGPRQWGWSDTAVDEAASEALASVGLPRDEFGTRHPYSLSGGEQRRLALAGVLAMRPRAMLLDEPTVSLDPAGRRDLVAVLRRLREGGVTMLLATHDVDLAWELCDRRLVLRGGELSAAGAWTPAVAAGSWQGDEGLRLPALVDLWRRLGLLSSPHPVPRSAAAAGAVLAAALPGGVEGRG
ncbi:MAG: ATP-binding cassette domain-containing protein, partial [Actinobacteria bacterium]|nr:ATP-binding cassette domain-containing protein [Actinomycetota bacterium]